MADGNLKVSACTEFIFFVVAQALAHSLDEHKRLVAAKQNQELLLANHFKSINLGEPTGQIKTMLTHIFRDML